MRCPDCNKFVGQETGEPEVNVNEDWTHDAEGRITGARFDADARIVVVCADCGTDLKEASFDLDGDFSESAVSQHVGDGHDLSMEVENEEATERTEGRGRGQRHFYGVSFTVVLRCKCRDKDVPVDSVECEDEIQASAMDELT